MFRGNPNESEYEMNHQRLEELAMINACREDSQDVQFYETNMSRNADKASLLQSRLLLKATKA